ncbi:MAG: zf-HC2 domain-containing protein [Anaerolineaceae bacterium]
MKHPHPASCQEVLWQINAYIDGELDPDLCSHLEAHIENCPDCQIVINTLKKTIQLCQGDRDTIALPPEAWDRLLVSLGLDDEDDKE